MKLVIQIPCFNEEEHLPVTVSHLPRKIEGIDEIELLVIDDGSTDNTVSIARSLGVNHIVKFARNRGLASAFTAGIDAAVRVGADIIVNTDADNQYNAEDITVLLQPILAGTADMVVGDRQTDTIEHFSPLKKQLQKLGSFVVRKISNTSIKDTTSGFRAFSREAAMKLNVLSDFSYTLETILQAGHQKIAVDSVPIRTNPMLRKSRLFKGIFQYIRKSLTTILYVHVVYNPLMLFSIIGLILFAVGFGLGVRFLIFFFQGAGKGHIQSLILAGTLIGAGVYAGMTGIIAWLIGANRKLMQEVLFRVKRLEAHKNRLNEKKRAKRKKAVHTS
jgi:glycosyltransferase involved in cell wall biosynthesis